MEEPKPRAVPERPLSRRERDWITEILQSNPAWADVDFAATRVVGECPCGECQAVYLDSDSPQNPPLLGTKGYIGRIEIRTADEFGIMITLDQRDGKLYELYVDFSDLSPEGNRGVPGQWSEVTHTVTSM
jgi:hypothetical protein